MPMHVIYGHYLVRWLIVVDYFKWLIQIPGSQIVFNIHQMIVFRHPFWLNQQPSKPWLSKFASFVRGWSKFDTVPYFNFQNSIWVHSSTTNKQLNDENSSRCQFAQNEYVYCGLIWSMHIQKFVFTETFCVVFEKTVVCQTFFQFLWNKILRSFIFLYTLCIVNGTDFCKILCDFKMNSLELTHI